MIFDRFRRLGAGYKVVPIGAGVMEAVCVSYDRVREYELRCHAEGLRLVLTQNEAEQFAALVSRQNSAPTLSALADQLREEPNQEE